jgi:predicted type IV restriction endonuclease
MVTKEEAKELVKVLVDEFLKYSKEEIDSKSEDQIRVEFIDPFFEAIGWDRRKDAERNEQVLNGRADYILKNENEKVLVIEAKKTSIKLSESDGKQAVYYAYNSGIKFCVLTNFKQIRIYHALSNPRDIDKNLLKDKKGYLWINCEDYLEQFDRLWLLSKESFQNGEITKLLALKDERINKPIDKSLLEDLLEIRKLLSNDLKKLRMELSPDQVDEVVQILVNRLIFMRSVEDRGLEAKDSLLKIVEDHEAGRSTRRLWEILKTQFKIYNKEYDSKIFEDGLLETDGFFDESTLIKVIKSLYFGIHDNLGRYMFDAIPLDVLGIIYEQYLGIILAGSGEKRVRLNSKTQKRKNMGIYYTPSYIVDYIVKNTIGTYIKDKSIDEILEVKILDPACGSGSFIVKSFEEVCKRVEDLLRDGKFSQKWGIFNSFKGRLSISQKSVIFENCIFGVDLDEKAVELAELNVALKILEKETRETKRKVLPVLKNNLVCGNSLVEDRTISKRAFNWSNEFKKQVSTGKFDIVVGNPPYGAELPEEDRIYLEKRFKLGNTDTACLFMGLARELLKDGGINGFIIPKPFVYSSTWENIRERLIPGLIEIVDCGKVWKEVKLEQVIYVYKKGLNQETYITSVRKDKEILFRGKINKNACKEFGFLLNGICEEELVIARKIKDSGTSLNEFVKNQRGAMYQKSILSKKSDFKVLGGAQVGRYYINDNIKGYLAEKVVKDNNAKIQENSILVQNIVAHIENPVDHIKIIASLVKDIKYKDYIILDTINQLSNYSKLKSEFLIAMINSKLISWYAYRFIFGKAIRTMHFDNSVTERIFIPKVNLEDKKEKNIYEKVICLVDEVIKLEKDKNTMKGHEKDLVERQLNNAKSEIDQYVFELFGIRDEKEKQIINSSCP